MLKIWGICGKQGSSESAVWISLWRGYFNCSLLFSSGASQAWSGSEAADKTWVHHWVCFTHAIHPLLWLTLGLLNIHTLPGLPMCWRSNCVKAKTAAYGPHHFLQDVMWTIELVGPQQHDLLQKYSYVFKQKFLISSSSAFQKLNRFVSVPPVPITNFGKWCCSFSVLL